MHGHEILIDGCFNGDPHPGNLLLIHAPSPAWSWSMASVTSTTKRPAGTPMAAPMEQAEWQRPPAERAASRAKEVGCYASGDRLGLIDYGQVKELSLSARVRFAQLLLALCLDQGTREDKLAVADALRAMGQRTKHDSTAHLYSMAKLVYDANDPEVKRARQRRDKDGKRLIDSGRQGGD